MELVKNKLRSGVTTGASAAAAALAAGLLLFEKKTVGQVEVMNPEGIAISVPVAVTEYIPGGARAIVIKNGGDDADVTHGMKVIAEVFARTGQNDVTIEAGTGIGIVTKPGLKIAPGEPAINPIPRRMITDAIKSVLPSNLGATVRISIPGGKDAAEKTLNPRLGIVGGLSVLGTTGIVKPMSEEALKESLIPMIEVAVAGGYGHVVLTPGRTGAKAAVDRYAFPETAVCEMRNYVGYMLDVCVSKGIKGVLLWGHLSKLVKVAAGIFNTHSRLADGRKETIAAYAAKIGASPSLVGVILDSVTVDGIVPLLIEHGLTKVFKILAQKASERATEHVSGRLKVGTAMLNSKGYVLGMDENALFIGGQLGCSALRLLG